MGLLDKENWDFPTSNGIGDFGASDSGIQNFKGSQLISLVREACQNSLDAAQNNKTAIVEFRCFETETSKIPRVSELQRAAEAGEKYCKDREMEKEAVFFQRVSERLNSHKIRVLRVSDFNTTGLCGSREDTTSPWRSMVLSEGVSNKSGNSGGSYGIGKSALFSISPIQMIFISTLDIDNNRAFQGIAKFPSFTYRKQKRHGKGYYGLRNRSDEETRPVHSTITFEPDYNRKEPGTDIFILGVEEDPELEKKILLTVLDHYIYSIWLKKLEVRLKDITVNQETIPAVIQILNGMKLSADEKKVLRTIESYFRVLSEKDTKMIQTTFFNDRSYGGSGTLFLNFHDGAPRSVLMSRSAGMKLFDLKGISQSIQFCGVFQLEGDGINQYFAKMENPSHDNWETDRVEELKAKNQAKRDVKEVKKWIKETILKLHTEKAGEETDVIGLELLLPEITKHDSGLPGNGKDQESAGDKPQKKPENSSHESLSGSIGEIKIGKLNKIAKQAEIRNPNTDDDGYYAKAGNGTIDPDGSYSAIEEQIRDINEGGEGKGVPAKGNSNPGRGYVNFPHRVQDYRKKLFMTDPHGGAYRLVLTPRRKIKNGYIEVFVSGETSDFKCRVKSAVLKDGTALEVKENRVMLPDVGADQKLGVNLVVDQSFTCSLEVKLYAH